MGYFGTFAFLYLLNPLCIIAENCADVGATAGCHRCAEDSFLCAWSGTCLPRDKLCDGTTDCPDGLDELADKCNKTRPAPYVCPDSEFMCRSGQCIPHSWRCDHTKDCADGSDEEDCDRNECLEDNGGCSHLCIDQPMGFVCDCPSGMRLIQDTQCEEIDECLDTDLCSQVCVHVNGSFTCECHAGYRKIPQMGECRAEGEMGLVALSSLEGVWQADTAGSEHRLLASGNLGYGPLAAFTAKHTLYWGDSKKGAIYGISLDGSSQKPVLVLAGLGAVRGLAVDWFHELLYWTDASTCSINVAPLSGSAQRLLVGGLSKPTGVAVEPVEGLLFWADSGSSARIERANLDGQDRMALVTSAIQNPVAISLDIPRHLLYWVDSGLRTISRVGLDGHHRKTVLESNGYLDKPFGLTVFEGQVFWTDKETHSLCSVDKHNGTSFRVLLSNVRSPGGLVVIHPVLQPKGQGVCGRPGHVCPFQCEPRLFGVDLPHFFCLVPKGGVEGQNESHPVEAAAFPDTTSAGLLSLLVVLSVILAGLTLWWCRAELSPSRTIGLHTSISLKESQDPLVPCGLSESEPLKDTLLNMDEVSR
ncbi:very low-density lipoprotein receptor-like isoform X2 [Scleropages formosus]|uniref:Very low-density lipoprotein receptor-like n=1 Tax=Scleropages formosus TaxID=113540 RepID=A0A8C9S783_SCLFO|nr:very low-density lipoprotein receptor-like isoform X2 [Scleropages formosus]